MYCRYCGKQIADDAVACPFCGKETGVQPEPSEKQPQSIEKNEKVVTTAQPQPKAESVAPQKERPAKQNVVQNDEKPQFPLSLLTAVLAGIAFVASLVLGSLLFSGKGSLSLYLLGTMCVLPSLAAICSSIVLLCRKKDFKTFLLGVISLSLAVFSLFYVFLVGCVA